MWILFLLFLVFSSFNSKSQTLDRWAQVVNWDGTTHWSKYMIMTPAFQGPNSLPVPSLGNGEVDSTNWLKLSGNFHFSKGDNTQNIILQGNYCLVKDIASIDLFWIPFEYYTLSDAIKEKRHVYYRSYKDHQTFGDVILNINLRILKKWSKYIDLGFRTGYRFPIGEDVGAARYTDAPGYYFDINYGKKIGKSGSLKWTGMLGFYVWQTNLPVYRQDDAFLFGTGIEWNKKQLLLKAHIAGYLGYFDEGGDDPVVFRLQAERRTKRNGFIFNFQQGLNDFAYSSFELGIKHYFKWKVKEIAKSQR